jgi:copper chaperone CopZ
MRNVVRLVTVVLALLALVAPLAADSRPDTVRTTFQVKGMHCGGCSSTITSTLENVDGVIEASADHEKGVAEAVYRPRKVEADELKAEIEKLGYPVSGMETDAVEG